MSTKGGNYQAVLNQICEETIAKEASTVDSAGSFPETSLTDAVNRFGTIMEF